MGHIYFKIGIALILAFVAGAHSAPTDDLKGDSGIAIEDPASIRSKREPWKMASSKNGVNTYSGDWGKNQNQNQGQGVNRAGGYGSSSLSASGGGGGRPCNTFASCGPPMPGGAFSGGPGGFKSNTLNGAGPVGDVVANAQGELGHVNANAVSTRGGNTIANSIGYGQDANSNAWSSSS